MRRRSQVLVHRGLNQLCMLVDAVAYRPAIVKLTIWLPRWWNCDFVRLSMWLDDQFKLVRILVASDNTEVVRD